MPTINQHISALRILIKEQTDDSLYTDQFLYHLLTGATSTLHRRNIEKDRKVSPWNTQSYCISLEVANSHDCSCVPVGCKVLKSKDKIPTPLNSDNGPMMKVYTLDHVEIFRVDEAEQRASMLHPIKKNRLSYSIVNGKIVLWNGNTDHIIPRAITVKGLFNDVTEWASIEACDESGNTTGNCCYDIDNDNFPLDEDFTFAAYGLVLQQLGLALQKKSDDNNNNNPEI